MTIQILFMSFVVITNYEIFLFSFFFLLHQKITNLAASIPGPRAIPPDNTQFAEVELNKRLQRVITSYGYWNMQFLTTEKAYVKFNFTIPRGSSIGFYARRNALPTHTQYDFNEVLSGFNQRTSRAAYQPTIHRDVMKFMEAGFWFISLYNDDGHDQEVTFFASVSGEMMRNCKLTFKCIL